MTREEIQAKIDAVTVFADLVGADIRRLNIEDLKNSLASAKSIKDLQEEAFYAARKDKFNDVPFEYNEYLYETFKDYLKTLET
jgi:hypothetical protein